MVVGQALGVQEQYAILVLVYCSKWNSCLAGEYVMAAIALGAIPARVANSSSLPDFRELTLWFQVLPGDCMAVAYAKV